MVIGSTTSLTGGSWRHALAAARRGFREFGAVPLAVMAGFAVVAAVSIAADQSHVAVLDAARSTIRQLIGAQAATSTLQAIATGLLTVTSITFSVLLLAVQQTATSLSPVVFDQFLRRRMNQVFLGFFVGLVLFAYVVMVAVQDRTPPILGAAVGTLLTLVALVILVVLVYATVDQMRPTSVLRQIHDRTLVARRREATLLRRTRREPRRSDGTSAGFRARSSGYVAGIDLGRLARALERLPSAEIRLHVTLGQHVAYGAVVATVLDDDESAARWLADEVREAVLLSARRDLAQDATTGIEEIGNIGWTSGSTAKHNPHIAREAVDALHDLAARWLNADPAGDDPSHDRSAGKPLAVVYSDNDLGVIFDVLYSCLVAAHESHQHHLAARVLETYAALYPLADEAVRRRIQRDVGRAEALLDEFPPSPLLDARRALLASRLADRPARDGAGPHDSRSAEVII